MARLRQIIDLALVDPGIAHCRRDGEGVPIGAAEIDDDADVREYWLTHLVGLVHGLAGYLAAPAS